MKKSRLMTGQLLHHKRAESNQPVVVGVAAGGCDWQQTDFAPRELQREPSVIEHL